MQNSFIGSTEQLAPETPVRVRNERGKVISSKLVNAAGCSGGKVVLHYIEFTERSTRGFGSNRKWEKLEKPTRRHVGYSSIQTL